MSLRTLLGEENYDLMMEIYKNSSIEEIDKHQLEAELNLQQIEKQCSLLRLEIQLMIEIKEGKRKCTQ